MSGEKLGEGSERVSKGVVSYPNGIAEVRACNRVLVEGWRGKTKNKK